MVASIVKLLLAFPGLIKLFVQIRDELEAQIAAEKRDRNRDLIREWMQYDKKPDTRIH
jgi:hypothetical protein